MSVLVIGGSRGVGKDIVEYFAPDSFSVSKGNGYDMDNSRGRKKIAQLSLDYDVIAFQNFTRCTVAAVRLLAHRFTVRLVAQMRG
jgi:hypothetical protein